jgi:hypothetical protein
MIWDTHADGSNAMALIWVVGFGTRTIYVGPYLI